jgi:hypothetical protein
MIGGVTIGDATAGGDTEGGDTEGGDAGSFGGASGSGVGEAGSTPGGTGGGATAGGDAGNVDGAGRPGSGESGGEDGGGSLDGGVAGQDRGEKRNLHIGSESRKSSTWFCRLLVLLAGGEAISGKVGDEDGDASLSAGATATGLDDWAGPLRSSGGTTAPSTASMMAASPPGCGGSLGSRWN